MDLVSMHPTYKVKYLSAQYVVKIITLILYLYEPIILFQVYQPQIFITHQHILSNQSMDVKL
jgi:hypothetical protein